MFGLGPLEIILLIVVIALLFGARKLPELGKGMGQGIREFKKEVRHPEITDVQAKNLGPVQDEPVVQNPSERR